MEDLEIRPSIIYKFRDWSNEFHKRVLTHCEIYFANPPELNDPFDVANPPDYSLLTEAEWRNKIDDLTQRGIFKNPRNAGHFIAMREERIRDKIWEDENFIEVWNRDLLNSYRSDSGIFSASRKFGHPLMWSHYANGHKGFCVGLNSKKVFEKTQAFFGPVIYRNEVERIKPTEEITTDLLKMYNSKYHIWEYEKEIRLFKLLQSRPKNVVIGPEAIDQVIIGCESSHEDMISILETIDANKALKHVRVFKLHKRDNSFRFDINRIERG